jgi:hypothetical protein
VSFFSIARRGALLFAIAQKVTKNAMMLPWRVKSAYFRLASSRYNSNKADFYTLSPNNIA